MLRKSLSIMIIALCVGLMLLLASGCAKKNVKQDPSIKSAEELTAEKERIARAEAERKEREQELARLKEEEDKKREQERKEFEQSLVAKRTPGIEGEVYESKLLKRIHFEFDKSIFPRAATVSTRGTLSELSVI